MAPESFSSRSGEGGREGFSASRLRLRFLYCGDFLVSWSCEGGVLDRVACFAERVGRGSVHPLDGVAELELRHLDGGEGVWGKCAMQRVVQFAVDHRKL